MEVMDLSLPKPHHVPTYSPTHYTIEQHYMLQQQQYLLQQQHLLQQQYAAAQPAKIISAQQHLGFFQQMQFNNQIVPGMISSPVRRTSSTKDENQTFPASPVEAAREKESAGHRETNNNNCRPHVKRPFKLIASSKSPTSMSLPAIIDPNSDDAYEEYRSKVLSQVVKGEIEPNRNMRRTIPSNPEKCNDPDYLERRKKNNEAAKKSREARKAKEDEIAIRVSFLEQENLKLKFQLAAIERQKKMYLLRLEQQQQRHNTTACF